MGYLVCCSLWIGVVGGMGRERGKSLCLFVSD